MLKHLITGCCFTLLATAASAQTLFTYANDSVSVKNFLKAFNKNNTKEKDAIAMRQYLDLYIASRLKIKEAIARGYDTLPQMVADLQNLRTQIIPAYLKDEETLSRLVAEAFERSQKDIQLQHILIAFNKDGVPDAAGAQKRAAEALQQLQKGKDFAEVARQFSDDPSAKANGGNMGFITVFSLPYELETLAYNTPAGNVSPLYSSKAGYHIFKNIGERKALGKIKAAQILLAFPPDADAATKKGTGKLADSLYNQLLKGADFVKLAAAFSSDVTSAQANGVMPEIGVGQYDALFENAVFSLAKDGAISKPFATAHGYHIVKRLERTPVSISKNDEAALQAIREKVENDERISISDSILAQKVLKKTSFKKQPFKEAELWAYTDSVLDAKTSNTRYAINQNTLLFNIDHHKATVSSWIAYAQTARFLPDGSGIKPYTQLWNEFVQAEALSYYKEHLEEFSEGFRQQLPEFREGNLFFEIMQQQVWNNTLTDTTALEAYYNQHKNRYNWQQSAAAAIFYTSDAGTAKILKERLAKTPAAWKTIAADFGERVTIDSGRYELAYIPNSSKQPLKKGTITQPLVNAADGTASFAYILHLYTQPAPRSFSEAKGLILTDYQAEQEKAWVESLKRKYPVKINESAIEKLTSR